MNTILALLVLTLLPQRLLAEDLTPEKYGTYCPVDFTKTPPIDFHTQKPLVGIDSKGPEIHRVVCDRINPETGLVVASWNLYFCEDLNVNNYLDSEFYVAVTPWFQFHPNFKKVEFMLFPKYTKWIRHQLPLQNDQKQEVMILNFMHSFQSEMQITYLNSKVSSETTVSAGARSIDATIFDNVKLKPREGKVICRLETN